MPANLTIAEAAARLGLTRQRVHVLAREGRLGRTMWSRGKRVFAEAAVEAFAARPPRPGGRPKRGEPAPSK
jgi:excisionase family DNA binding protein